MNKDTSKEPLTEPLDPSNSAGDSPPVDGGPWIKSTGEPNQPPSKHFKHIDDFLEDSWIINKFPELAYPHFMFTYWRQSAAVKSAHAPFMTQFELYVDYQGRSWRVIGASRMGDVWLTKHFHKTHGYDLRVDPNFELFTNWRNKADWELSYEERLTLARATGFDFAKLSVKYNTPALKQTALDNWTKGNGIPARYIDLTPEQRQILQTARFKRSMETTP